MPRFVWSAFLTVCLLGSLACDGGRDKRAQAQLEALAKKKEAAAAAQREAAKPVPVAEVSLPSPYGDEGNTVIASDGPCPEGFWALLPYDAPGATPEDKKANTAKRKELVEGLRGRRYLVKLRAPAVTLSPYDAPSGQFSIEVPGTIDCVDPTTKRRVALAWTDAKAGTPAASAAKEGSELVQQVWMAPTVRFAHPIPSMEEAKRFEQGNRIGLSARVVFTLGKVEVDRKVKRVAKVQEKAHGEALEFGGGDEDWGAGPLVRAQLVALRVGSQGEKTQLHELRP